MMSYDSVNCHFMSLSLYDVLCRIGRRLSHAGLLTLAGICCIGWAFGNWAGERVRV